MIPPAGVEGRGRVCAGRSMSRRMVLQVPSAAHREGGLEGPGWCSQEVVQFPWSRCPVAGLGIGRREGGLGRKERSNSQASSVGPWLDAGGDANVVTPMCSPQKAVLWQIQKPLPSSLALTVPRLLTPELTHLGTLFKWQHLCCCHKGEVVFSCCSTQILGWAN